MSFQASTRNFLHRGLRQCFVHLSGRTSGHKWWIPLWQLCFVVEQRISFKQAFDPNTALPIYGFTFPPFCEAKIHWKNLNPSNSEASPTVTDQTNSPILTLKMKVDGRWLSFSKGLFFFQVAGLRSFLGCINQNSRHSSGQQRQHHIAGIAVRRGMEWCPTTLIQFILTKKVPPGKRRF